MIGNTDHIMINGRMTAQGAAVLTKRMAKGLAAVFALACFVMIAGVGAVDAAQPLDWQLNLQESASPVMTKIHEFHTFILVIIVAIVLLVLALLIYCMARYNAGTNPNPSRTSHNTTIEVVWTVVPILILVIIAIPSFRLLFFEQTIPEADLTVKAVGVSWYWDYEYPDNGDFRFSSFMLETPEARSEKATVSGGVVEDYPRLLAVDNEMVVPVNKNIRLIVTSDDVLHAFALPAFGVKKDAVPGRLNETWFRAERTGIYYGQCSELCGVNHAYMPIAIRVVTDEQFDAWVTAAADDVEEANRLLAGMLKSERQLASVSQVGGDATRADSTE